MGFLGGIGRAISNVAKTVTNVAGKVSNIAGKVANIAGKAVNILQDPAGALSSFVKKAAGGLLDKLPEGLKKFIGPVAEKLIDKGVALLSKGRMGSILEFAKKLAPRVGDLADFAEKVKKTADKVGVFTNDVVGQSSRQNLQEAFALAQATGYAQRYAA
jgi:hypothetical protein